MIESRWRAHPRWSEVAELSLTDLAGDPWRQLLVVVAHPDDESLAVGGLIHRAAVSGVAVTVVVATDGEASHPESRTHTPGQLRELRRAECPNAVEQLAPRARLVLPGLPDGGLSRCTDQLATLIGEHLDQLGAAGTLVVSTWRDDGHPDHEAVAQAAAAVCTARGVRLLEAPIWLWAWREPEQVPWSRLRRLSLDAEDRSAKVAAIAAHHSQTHPLSPLAGDEPVVPPEVVAHFERDWESFVEEPHDPAQPAEVFDAMYADSEDPWRFEGSWFEERKRALTLAALPGRDVGGVLEVGPATGLLTLALAERAASVLAVEISAQALQRAQRRLAVTDLADRVRWLHADVAEHWPTGTFDTVVVSEVGYFLTEAAWREVARSAGESLSARGSLVLVHWRHPIEGWPLDGEQVHRIAEEVSGLRTTLRLVDDDFLLQVLRPGGVESVAAVEGRC